MVKLRTKAGVKIYEKTYRVLIKELVFDYE